MDEQRKAFEAWISAPPLEKDVRRYPQEPERFAWPGVYRVYEVQVAWEAWQEATRLAVPAGEEKP